MPPRQRSFSQDRLGDPPPLSHFRGPHSASQDFLLHQHHWGHPSGAPSVIEDSCWSRAGRARSENQLAGRRELHGRSLDTLDTVALSPQLKRPAWLQQQGQHSRSDLGTSAPSHRERAPQPGSRERGRETRRLPPPQSFQDPLVGYRKTDLLLGMHSLRDPFCTWPIPKTSPLPLAQDGVRRPTNHERGRGGMSRIQQQEVVLRQKAPMGWLTSHGFRHPRYALPTDPPDPPAQGDTGPRSASGGFPPLPRAGDSLASIPFIDEPTSPRADLQARNVPASSVISSAMSSAPVINMSSAPVINMSSAPVINTSSAPVITTSPASPLTRLFSHDCSSIKDSHRSSYLLISTMERSKSCDEGLDTLRDEGRVFSLDAVQDARTMCHSTSELSNLTFSDVHREGWLHYKQILTEKGKKAGSGMHPWKRVFSVLRSHALFLYKDKREAVLFNPAHSEDEQPISIHGCLVDIAYSETRRKHALRLTHTHNDSGFCGQALINKKLNDYRKQSPTGSKPDSSPKGTRMKPPFLTATGAPRSPKQDSGNKEDSSPPKSPWGMNIMKKVKKPGPKAFGVRLEDCQHGFVPLIVELCCGQVEEMGLECTGIYRVPGNNAVVSSLQEQLNKGSIDINPADEIRDLPDYYSHTLKFLVGHLKKVADHSEKNKMAPRNLALVFGPTLVRTSEDSVSDMVMHMPDRYKIVETLIQHVSGEQLSIDFTPSRGVLDKVKYLFLFVFAGDVSKPFTPEPEPLPSLFVFQHTWFFSEETDKDDKHVSGEQLSIDFTPSRGILDKVKYLFLFVFAGDVSKPFTPEPEPLPSLFVFQYTWFFSEETDKDDKTPVDKADMQPMPNIDHLLPNIGRTGGLEEASVDKADMQPMPNIDHLLPNIGRTGGLEEASDSTNSDSAKSKGSWGRELYSREIPALSTLSAVTRKRKKHRDARVWSSSTDEGSEHEPIKTSHRGGRGLEGEGERQRDDPGGEEESPPLDARSIVSGYSTQSTLGGHEREEADDERSELLSESGVGLPETDTESGFASHPQTQERPPKQDRQRRDRVQLSQLPPRSFLYAHCTPPESPRSDSPSSLSSSTAPRLHSWPSFNSRRAIRSDTLARKKLREGERGPERGAGGGVRSSEEEAADSTGSSSSKVSIPRAECSSLESLRQGGETRVSASLSLASAGKPLLRPHSSADDMFGVGLRKPHSPETCRKKKAWRRHTVVVNTRGMSDPQSGSTLSELGSEGRPRSGSYGSCP
ncbi:UNVERIFIED_CONTAM: hypothetical protein FKN15_052614 [Acipenser sinensis]